MNQPGAYREKEQLSHLASNANMTDRTTSVAYTAHDSSLYLHKPNRVTTHATTSHITNPNINLTLRIPFTIHFDTLQLLGARHAKPATFVNLI